MIQSEQVNLATLEGDEMWRLGRKLTTRWQATTRSRSSGSRWVRLELRLGFYCPSWARYLRNIDKHLRRLAALSVEQQTKLDGYQTQLLDPRHRAAHSFCSSAAFWFHIL